MYKYTIDLGTEDKAKRYFLLAYIHTDENKDIKCNTFDFLLDKPRMGIRAINIENPKTVDCMNVYEDEKNYGGYYSVSFQVITDTQIPVTVFDYLKDNEWTVKVYFEPDYEYQDLYSFIGLYKDGKYIQKDRTDVRFWILKLYEGKGTQSELKQDYLQYMREFRDKINLQQRWECMLKKDNIRIEP